MDKKTIRWPDGLPPPVEVKRLGRLISLLPADLNDENKVSELVEEIYWEPNDFYYIFTKANEGFGEQLNSSFKNQGLISNTNSRCHYLHPDPICKNNFVHLPPDKIKYDWHREVANTQEYTRHTIELAPWRRKEIDIQLTATATIKAAADAAPIIEAKPGVMGFNIDLLALLRKIMKIRIHHMRTLSYLILMPLAWFASGYAFSWLAYPLYGLAKYGLPAYPILFLAGIPSEIIKVLIVFRVIFWFKNKSIAAPEQYSNWIFVLGAIVSTFMLLVIFGYAYLILSKASGISGVPLGFALGISSLVSIIPVLVVEMRSLYALIPTKK